MDDKQALWALRNDLERRLHSIFSTKEAYEDFEQEAFERYLEAAHALALRLNDAFNCSRQIKALDDLVQGYNEQKFRLEGVEK